MKKLYSLLAAAGIAFSAYAAAPLPTHSLQFSPAGDMTAHSYTKAEFDNIMQMPVGASDGMIKIIDKNTDKDWSCVVFIEGEWGLVNNETNEPIEFNVFPFFHANFACEPKDGSSTIYQVRMNWPCYGALNDDCWVKNDKGQFEYLDEQKVLEMYGPDKAMKPMSFEDFLKENGSGLLYTLPGFYPVASLIGPEAFGEAGQTFRINGQGFYPISSTFTNDGKIDYSNATTLEWDYMDVATSDIHAILTAKYSSTIGGSLVGTTPIDLEGTAVLLGFADITWDTIEEVHIFNGGRQDENGEWMWNYEALSPVPLNYYYICFCDNTMGYMAVDKNTNERIQNFTNNTLPVNQLSSGIMTGCPSYAFDPNYHFTFLAGALWAQENSEFPYGIWTMKEPTMDGNTPMQMPEANNLVVAGLSDFCSADGFYGAYEGYPQYALPGQTFIGVGDKRLGLNFKVGTAMSYGHYIVGSYVGDIIYHSTPDKWVDVMVDLPAIGNVDANVMGMGDNSAVESVESDAPVVSKAYYNFQGQRLAGEPESGMYIIRAVKADGTVKSTKVTK